MDAAITSITTIATTVATIMVAQITHEDSSDDLRMLLVPLIGAMIMSGGAIMLNPQEETRKIIIGRAVVGLFLGATAPGIMVAIYPAISPLVKFPAVLLFLGAAFAAMSYVLSKPFFSNFYARSDAIASRGVDAIDDASRKSS